MALTLVLNDFSGPLDFVLALIRTNEVDIYDIPIAEITAQYLDYLYQMQDLALDVAGDYFVMAANLMVLKVAFCCRNLNPKRWLLMMRQIHEQI